MEINQNLIEVLYDLIKINNNRIAEYEKAVEHANDSDIDLKMIFNNMADESRKYVSELSNEIYKLGGQTEKDNNEISGKIYNAWSNIKIALSGNTRLSLLESCEAIEDAAQNAYQQALVADETLSIDIRQLISNQKRTLQDSHKAIRQFRDMHKKAESDDVVAANALRSSENDLRNDKYLKRAN